MEGLEKLKSHFAPHQKVVFPLLVIIIAAIVLGVWQLFSLTVQVSSLKSELALSVEKMDARIIEVATVLTEEVAEDRKDLTVIKEKLGIFEDEVGTISGALDSLEKLSKTDPELLQKYSKVFFLNEHYVPDSLSKVSSKFNYHEDKDIEVHSKVWPHLKEMMEDALDEEVEIYVYSGYRSFGTQASLKGQYTVSFGEGANKFSADQGYSEHQLGTTVDLITTGISGSLTGFEKTEAYEWLKNNAYKYGFTLSYPEANKYYVFEPWHWRFVGVKLATYLNKNNLNFYDADQRKIDEYLISLFD